MPHFEPPVPTTRQIPDLPDGHASAVEVYSGPGAWMPYVMSYRVTADHLAEVCSRDPWREWKLAVPMLFCYRHYIELHLKSLLLDAGELLDDPQAIPPTHYIASLWGRVRAALDRIHPFPDDAWAARADEIIRTFDAMDPSSFAFRYPVDKAGNAALPERLFVDPSNVAAIIDELAILLDGASAMIHEYRGFKHGGY